jgi:DNA-binding LacI/PurR family transcriptional regulator
MTSGKTGTDDATGIKGIARLAGVSPATVSRVINNRPGVRPELRQAVEQVVRERGLHLDTAARALKSRKTYRLAVITPRPGPIMFANPFFTEILCGISQVTEQAGYSIVLFTAATSQTLYEVNRNRSCDGVLFVGFRKSVPEPQSLKGAIVPVVTIPRPGPRYRLPFVSMDDEAGAMEATRHLLARGHERIALLNGPHNSIYSINRLAGYRKALQSANISFDQSLVEDGDFVAQNAHEAAIRLLTQPKRPTAVLATSDHMAVGAMDAVRGLGLRIPEDVALVGFGNTPVCTEVSPTLSSVDEHLRELGVQAASLLLQLAQGEEVANTQLVIPTRLVIRGSS